MKNRKFHQFILLLTASIAIGCTKHQETNNDDVSENKYEIAEWDNVPVNLVSKEKEMDISLKKEYEKGWFGNAKLAGGSPISAEDNKNQPVIIERDALYN